MKESRQVRRRREFLVRKHNGSVPKADYYFGDVRYQRDALSKTIGHHNSSLWARHFADGGKEENPPAGLIDASQAIRRMHKRVAQFYGYA